MTYRVRHPELHQEEDEVPRWKVILALVVVVAVSALLIVWTVDLVSQTARELRPSGVFPEQWLGPRRVVARVRQDLFAERRPGQTVDAEQRRALGSYGWVDRSRGVVRIPIEEAMDLVAGGEKP